MGDANYTIAGISGEKTGGGNRVLGVNGNSTAPTTSVVSVGDDNSSNKSSTTYVMYLFAEIEGYSKFGTYDGNSLSKFHPVISLKEDTMLYYFTVTIKMRFRYFEIVDN